MEILYASEKEIDILCKYDNHIDKSELENLVKQKRIYIARESGSFAGWLRYNLFWDNTPFMNMLFVFEEYRGKGIGKALVEHWEQDMKNRGYNCLMTSTASNEYAQHFYDKLGYIAVGGFMPEDSPYELILSKKVSS